MLVALITMLPIIILISILLEQRKKRVRKFDIKKTTGVGYTCPMCSLENDTKCVCERCGFNPFTKEGGEDHDVLYG